MLENLFLNYANYRLIDTPNNFIKIFESINFDIFREYKEYIRESIKLVAKFSEYETPEIAEENFQKDFDKFTSLLPAEEWFSIWYTNDLWFNSAYLAVHGYFNGCIYTGDNFTGDCDLHGAERGEIFHNNLSKGNKRLKCHECDQLFFVSFLDEIIKGKEYSQMNQQRDCFRLYTTLKMLVLPISIWMEIRI